MLPRRSLPGSRGGRQFDWADFDSAIRRLDPSRAPATHSGLRRDSRQTREWAANPGLFAHLSFSPETGFTEVREKIGKVSGSNCEYSRFAETLGGDGFDQDCRPTMTLCWGQFSRPNCTELGTCRLDCVLLPFVWLLERILYAAVREQRRGMNHFSTLWNPTLCTCKEADALRSSTLPASKPAPSGLEDLPFGDNKDGCNASSTAVQLKPHTVPGATAISA